MINKKWVYQSLTVLHSMTQLEVSELSVWKEGRLKRWGYEDIWMQSFAAIWFCDVIYGCEDVLAAVARTPSLNSQRLRTEWKLAVGTETKQRQRQK